MYVAGKDKIKGNSALEREVSHDGFNVAGTLYWNNKVGLSLVYGQYKFRDDNPLTHENEDSLERKDITLHVSYMVRPNVRVGAEYTRTDYSKGEDIDISSLVLDFSF